jgi:pyruvate dehydrogenase E2 component (dihydrolipoamide acetyltransferase)
VKRLAKNINMPRLGLTMTEGKMVRWLKAVGEPIGVGEEIAEIESDKAVATFESPESGYLLKILVNEGENCPIYDPIAVVGEKNEKINDIVSAKETVPTTEEASKTEEKIADHSKRDVEEGVQEIENNGRVFISPSARRLARENNIDVERMSIPPGKKRIEKNDVIKFLQKNSVKATPLASKIAQETGVNLAKIDKPVGERIYSADIRDYVGIKTGTEAIEKVIPVSGMRKIIAARMKSSIEVAAHVSLTTEVNMANLNDFRNRIRDRALEQYGVKVTVNDIIVKCAAVALVENPRINSIYTDKEIIEKSEVNVGVAVALDEGLIVPVIRNANTLSIGNIASLSRSLAEKARRGKLQPDEITGGTFTVSNLGMYDITQFTSIINQPESAILSAGKIVERPVVIDGEIAIKPMMNLTISFDHRPIDGSVAAIFLRRIKNLLEEPYALML